MHQSRGAGRAQNRHVNFGSLVFNARIVVLGPGHNRGRTIFQGDVLRVIKYHGPARAVVAHLVIAPVAVLVPAAAAAVGRIDVGMPVRMHDKAGPQHALQPPYEGRIGKDLIQLRNPGQDIISRIALLFKGFFGLLINSLVQAGRQVGFKDDKTPGDVLPHLCIAKQIL